MKRILFILLLSFVSTSLLAQSKSAENSIKDISHSLALINQKIIEVSQLQQEQIDSEKAVLMSAVKTQKQVNNKSLLSAQAAALDFAISSMNSLKKQYENNPYVSIAGFSINSWNSDVAPEKRRAF